MKIEEQPAELKVRVSKMKCDEHFSPMPPPPLSSQPHVYLYVGQKKSGKTTLASSLIASDKEPHRAYYKTQDNIYICIPENSLHSITEKAIKEHDKIYNDFDLDFLTEIDELTRAAAVAEEPEFSLVLIDDASAALKKNKAIQDKFTTMIHRHRHSRTSYHILVQDLLSVPISIRRNVDGIFFFKPLNAKSSTAFVEEFLGDLNKDEVRELFNYVFDAKGNFLFVKTGSPPEFFKNFNKLNLIKNIES